MDTSRIVGAVQEIEQCKTALRWLEDYGHGLTAGEKECASVTVKLNYASACPGAREAEAMLSRFAMLGIAEVVRAATENCRNTIAICEDVIRAETRAI